MMKKLSINIDMGAKYNGIFITQIASQQLGTKFV